MRRQFGVDIGLSAVTAVLCLFIRTITRHQIKPGSPNLAQRLTLVLPLVDIFLGRKVRGQRAESCPNRYWPIAVLPSSVCNYSPILRLPYSATQYSVTSRRRFIDFVKRLRALVVRCHSLKLETEWSTNTLISGTRTREPIWTDKNECLTVRSSTFGDAQCASLKYSGSIMLTTVNIVSLKNTDIWYLQICRYSQPYCHLSLQLWWLAQELWWDITSILGTVMLCILSNQITIKWIQEANPVLLFSYPNPLVPVRYRAAQLRTSLQHILRYWRQYGVLLINWSCLCLLPAYMAHKSGVFCTNIWRWICLWVSESVRL